MSQSISTPATRPALRRFYEDEGAREHHATWTELFYDLVFVVAVAALARALHHHPTPHGFLVFGALFVPVWWAWMGFTFYADQFEGEDRTSRVLMLVGMLFTVVMGGTIEAAGEGRSTGFAAAYAGQLLVLIALFARAWRHVPEARALCTRFLIGYTAGVALWLASLAAEGPVRYGMWALALAIQVTTPIVAVATMQRMPVHPSHIPERFGLFTLIVLGETVVAVASGTAGTQWNAASIGAAAAGFVAASALWWLYFGALSGGEMPARALQSFTFGYTHLFVFAALTAFGAGVHLIINHVNDAGVGGGARAAVAGGAALFIVAVTVIQGVTRNPPPARVVASRAAVAAVCAALALAGATIPPLFWIVSLAVVLVGLGLIEELTPAAIG